MGAEGRGEWSEERLCPPQKKNEFLPEIGGFWCILGLLFMFMQKLVRSMGRPPLPAPLESATANFSFEVLISVRILSYFKFSSDDSVHMVQFQFTVSFP